jgi:pimeloyl-ACP methyl ester carboxylesterase
MAGFSPTIRHVMSRGHAISYEDTGHGHTVILIPGLMGRAADWRDTGYAAPLAAKHRVLGIDPLGHGRSDKPHGWSSYNWPDVAADIIAVMDDASISRAALWGYSRGAILACAVAIEHPARVSTLILGGGPPASWTIAPPTEAPPFVSALREGDWPAFWGGFPFPVQDKYRQGFERNNDPRAIGAVLEARYHSRYVLDLSRVRASTFMYCGQSDADSVSPTAKLLEVTLQTLDGLDHLGGYFATDRIMPLAVAHLERARIWQAAEERDSFRG